MEKSTDSDAQNQPKIPTLPTGYVSEEINRRREVGKEETLNKHDRDPKRGGLLIFCMSVLRHN